MKGILTIFNKMEHGAFEDQSARSAVDRQKDGSSQGGKISGIVRKIKDGYLDKEGALEIETMREHLYITFDYPYPEISKLFDDTNPFDADKHFYQVVARHIKLFFDTIPKEKLLNFKEDDRVLVCRNFLQDVLELELEQSNWHEPLKIPVGKREHKVADKDIEKVRVNLSSKLRWDGERFQLTQKFPAQLPDSLQLAVAELEQQVHEAEERDKAANKAKGKGKRRLAAARNRVKRKPREN